MDYMNCSSFEVFVGNHYEAPGMLGPMQRGMRQRGFSRCRRRKCRSQLRLASSIPQRRPYHKL